MALSLVGMGVFVERIAEAEKANVERVQEWLSGNVSLVK